MAILAIDPGTAKCGIAVVKKGTSLETLHREIALSEEVNARVVALIPLHGVSVVLVGNATGGKVLARTLRGILPAEILLHTVPEAHTSERARARYNQENPPRGWHRLLPSGLRTPPEPYDDYAALILAEDWLALNPQVSDR